MYPGLSEADCQVAEFRYRQLVAEGQHQQLVAGLLRDQPIVALGRRRCNSVSARSWCVPAHRLQGLNTVTRQSLDTVATGERAAIA